VKKNKKGFTLIELLAVIVILGLLMAIAIPSVTRYITQSRKKTAVSTIGNYISAVVNEVNDLEYTFTGTNTIYAVPIECISIERGGKSPFGEWLQANDAYWAYVLVQYDELSSSYTYGFTFKDSAGYGIYPMSEAKIDTKGSQIQTGLNLTRPKNGKATSFIESSKWDGFLVDDNTNLVVLSAVSEGEVADGKTTCTLCQGGSNGGSNNVVEPQNNISNTIKNNNEIITTTPTLTTSSNNSTDESGLYSSKDTTNGNDTYYFRGNVTNNNVKFAGFDWKIIRINEDGTVRLILNGNINNLTYIFNSSSDSADKMYYSNGSNAKQQVDSWYQANIIDKGYDSYVANGTFCEAAKVKGSDSYTGGSATMQMYTAYTPDFTCQTDGNGKGILKSKVGLITYDELVYAGGYNSKANNSFYLYNGNGIWTMSPAGYDSAGARSWYLYQSGFMYYNNVNNRYYLRPVINLNANLLVDGSGTSASPFEVVIK